MVPYNLLEEGVPLLKNTLLALAIVLATVSLSAQTLRCHSPLPVPSFDLENATIGELQAKMASGALTSRSIVEKYLARIAYVDRGGPTLRAIIELNPDALAIADALDAERKSKGPRGPLHGIPVIIKDNIDTADRMLTTAGSLALAKSPASRDAFIVEQLREAGAVILGKSNLSEWANFRSTRSVSGWSARGGQTRNPYVLDRNPCGSSSGSGVAIAADLAVVAVGTETDGSIVCPASINGIVGIKPTLGLVSRSGIIPIAHSQDTAGPMTRSVRDAAILLGVLAGGDPRDPITQDKSVRREEDYAAALRDDALKGARIGVVRTGFNLSTKTDAVLDATITALRREGAEVIDVEIPTLGKFDDSEFEVLLYEFKEDLNKYLASRGPEVPRTLEALIAFNEKNRERELPYFGQEIFTMAQEKGPLTTKAYIDALAKDRDLTQTKGIDATLKGKKLDALVMITNGPAWPIDLVNGDHYTGGSSSPAAVAGYPSVTIPAGFVAELPVGISFVGAAWSDAKLLGYAYDLEQATKARKAPRFCRTLVE